MGRLPQKLELTWYNKDQALILTEEGKYGYTWVDPKDPRYCETHTLIFEEIVAGAQTPKQPGKTYSQRADLAPTEDNLLIHGESGDVLEALTQVAELAEKYVGKVQCVYIDPPFNTSKTFDQYEDNLEHSIWLTMMRDRLVHIRHLLSDEGSIWVHLNDSENHRMRVLLDEVFGAGNFLAEVVWEKADSPRRGDGFSDDHDNIIVYGKSENVLLNKAPRTEADNARFKNPDNDPLGPWWDGDPAANNGDGSGGMCYAIQNPLTGELMRPPAGSSWRLAQSTYFEELNKWAPYRYENLHDAEWRAENEGVPIEKASDDVCAIVLDVPVAEARRRVEERRKLPNLPKILIRSTGGLGRKSYIPEEGTNPRTLWRNEDVGHNRAAKNEIKKLFPGRKPFSTPKPERLLERVIQVATNPGDIVLDVFAGSGTTAAVAQKMGRRWVTCELIESTVTDFIRPRLIKVINDEDPNGVTLTKGERIDATDEGLPEDVTAQEAFRFSQLLSKLLKDDEEDDDLLDAEAEDTVGAGVEKSPVDPSVKESLRRSKDIRALKSLVKTRRTKDTINWRGGGSFRVARLSPSCFDHDPDLDLTTLTEAATGQTLVASVAANLRFFLTPEDRHFDGLTGRQYLAVVEGVLDDAKVDDLMAHLPEGHTLLIAATIVPEGIRDYVRDFRNGSRVVHIPLDIFSYTKAQEEN